MTSSEVSTIPLFLAHKFPIGLHPRHVLSATMLAKKGELIGRSTVKNCSKC
ncbi:hypothetical protein SMDB11_4320 [Serratia marcescens subsp. marcescens Db11]|uniref:Uncharacterized protein n=1 Tax=Serratia marcescens subsp. marcescens Db11 TaxID=273526 RepID=A0ABC9IQ76_SERMA|nr:hypothetical protein SMDB11_4320 [Serratia marcescens subsp. marcescens Db11]